MLSGGLLDGESDPDSELKLESGTMLVVSVSLGRIESVILEGEESLSGLEVKLTGDCVSSVVLRCVMTCECCVLFSPILLRVLRLLDVFRDCTGVPNKTGLEN